MSGGNRTRFEIERVHGCPDTVACKVSVQNEGATLFLETFAKRLREMFGSGFAKVIEVAMESFDDARKKVAPRTVEELHERASFSITIVARYGKTWAVGSCGPGTVLAKRRDGTVDTIDIGGKNLLARRYEPLYLDPYEPLVDPSVDPSVGFETVTLPAETYVDVSM